MRNIVTVTPGQRFGRLTVIRETEHQYGHRYILCQCDCGNTKAINLNSLIKGTSNSCGCYRREYIANRNLKHGLAHRETGTERIYKTWVGMKRRCYSKSDNSYNNYGARGIKVCDEWLNDYATFRKWALDNGYDETKSRKDQSLDRIDVNGNYEPSNCRWVTAKEQGNNTRVNHRVTYNGETHTLSEWGDILGISPDRIGQRLKKNMPLELVFYKGNLRYRNKEVSQ